MEKIKVSACIVTHNSSDCISSALLSLLTQTKGVDLQLFVVDNCSHDSTVDIIKKSFKQASLHCLKKNSGFAAGHNFVLPRLNSKYHAIINPDIEIKSDVLSQMVSYLEENENIGLLSPKILYPSGAAQPHGKRRPNCKYLLAGRFRNEQKPSAAFAEYAMLEKGESAPFEIENASGCFMLIRTELLKKLNGFDERFFLYFEDSDLTLRLNKISSAFYFPQAAVYHSWARDSKKKIRFKLIEFKSMLYFFKKHGWE